MAGEEAVSLKVDQTNTDGEHSGKTKNFFCRRYVEFPTAGFLCHTLVLKVSEIRKLKLQQLLSKRLTLSKSGFVDLVGWFHLNVLITLYGKFLYSANRFPLPVLMTAIHIFCTWVGINVFALLGLCTLKPIPFAAWRTICFFSFIFTGNIVLANAALLAVSVNTHQVVRTVIPLTTMLLSAIIFRKKYPSSLVAPVLLVIVGVSLVLWRERLSLTFYSFVVVLFSCLFSSLKGILTQQTQIGCLGMSAADCLNVLSPLALIQLLALSLCIGEIEHLSDHYTFSSMITIHVLLLGLIAFGVNITSFRCAAVFSPLTLNIAGNLKQLITCLLAVAFFQLKVTTTLLSGLLLAAIGASWYFFEYSRWKLAEKEEKRSLQRGV